MDVCLFNLSILDFISVSGLKLFKAKTFPTIVLLIKWEWICLQHFVRFHLLVNKPSIQFIQKLRFKKVFTTLEFIRSIFTVLLTIAEPHTGNAAPTWTSKVAFVTPLPMGNWESKKTRLILWALAAAEVIILSISLIENKICLSTFVGGFLNLSECVHRMCFYVSWDSLWQFVSSA